MLKKLLCFLSFLSLSNTAFSAEVKKINEKTGAIYINEGDTTGFSKGNKVCLFDGEKKVACGKITKSVHKKAIVRVPKKKFDRIHLGFTVALLNTDKESNNAITKSTSFKSPYTMSIGVNAHFLPMTPASYNNLDYVAPLVGNTSLWETTSTSNKILIPPGFGVEFELINLNIALGFRFAIFSGSSTATLFDEAKTNLTMTSDTKATDLGAYFNFIYLRRWDLNFGIGVDYDLSTVVFNGTQTDDNDETVSNNLYNATSALKVISLRLPLSYKYAIGSFGINLEFDALIPLYVMGPTQSLETLTSPNLHLQSTTASSIVPTQDADLSESLAHQKQSFAADVVLGIFYQF